jgi:hypothetical protein
MVRKLELADVAVDMRDPSGGRTILLLALF